MTRNTLTQTLSFAFGALVLGLAMPVAAWTGSYDHSTHYDNDRDQRERTPACSIEVRPNTVPYYGGTVSFSWESRDAEWAEITDIGIVPVDGSQKVTVYSPKTYRMTVYNGSRSAECDTFVNVLGQVQYSNNNYYQPNYYGYQYGQAPYVALTQIPYTGFDFGPLGNAIYWMMLATLAIGGAYLLVYQAGMRALASVPVVEDVIRAGRMQYRAAREIAHSVFTRPVSEEIVQHMQPALESTLVTTRIGSDTMQVIEGEMPRIIVKRD